MTNAKLLVAALPLVGLTVFGGDQAFVFTAGSENGEGVFRTVWDDGSIVEHRVTVGREQERKFDLPDALIDFRGLMFHQGKHGGKYHVRPRIKRYGDNRKLEPEGVALTNGWNALPSASQHALRVDVVENPDGGHALWLDGAWMTNIRNRKNPAAKLAKVVFEAKNGATVKPITPLFKEAKASGKWPVELPLDLAFRPNLGKVADVAICKKVKGSWALECEEYLGRTTVDAYPYAIHFSVPAAVYSQAKVRFALDPDPKKTAIANFRLAYFLDYGSGSVMVSDSPLDLTGGVPASAKKVGTDRIGGKEVPIYEMTVALRPEKLVDVAAREEYIDFEVVGPTVKGGKQYPDPERKSAFRIHALSLVKASVALDETDDPAHPGHIFTIDERGKRIAFTAKPQVAGGSVRTRWTCRDVHGRELFRGTEREIDLDRIDEPGLYSFFIEAEGDDGYVLRHEMRAALVVPSGRVSAKTESPFGTWVWLGGHGTPDKWETLAIPLQKIGVRKCTFRDIPKEIQEKYDLTFTGHVYAPRESTFDPKTGHFKPQGDLDGEAAFVKELQKQVDAAPFANHVLVWHESSPRSGVPPELHGDPAPEVTEKDRARAAYLNEVGRLVHKHFPKLRLQIGNSDNSMGAMSIMYRAGAKPEYFDSLGNEDACQSFCPEMLSTGGPQASKIERDAVRRLTGRTVKIDACYEFGSRRDPTLGERLQAAWFMRDAISCLADGYTLMMLPSMYDGRYGYYDSLWGAGSMARRMPYLQPKQLLVAAAALTKALDGVTFVRELDTGSTTVYAFLFKRMDGRYVTACWCSRGEAEIDLGLSGSAEAMDMYGHSIGLNRGVWPFGKRVVACGECPAYVISDRPAESAKIVKRTFEHGARLAAKGVKIGSFDSAEKVTLRPEPKLKSESKHSLPVLVPGKFEVETVNDPERGASLKVMLGEKTTNVTEYVTEYTTVRLKEPMEMPGRPCAFGVWVKGNSSWGRIRFEFTDAKGRVFGCYWRAGGWNPFDWPAVYAVNFDGWAFVSGSLDNSPLHWDDTLGLVGNAPSWPWRQISGPDFVTGKVYDYPIRLTAISVSVNRSKFTLIDGFKPSDPSILLNDVVSIELPDKMVK